MTSAERHRAAPRLRVHEVLFRSACWIVTIASLVMSFRIAYRTGGMAWASRFDTPYADHWDQIPIKNVILDGTGSWQVLWAQQNEHRIVLFHLLDVIDALYFHGTGLFLLAVNWLMVMAIAAILIWLTWRIPTLSLQAKFLGLAVIIGTCFSSAQIENFGFPMGNTNIGVYLFGLATLAGVAFAAQKRRAWAGSGLSALAALLGTVSLVSGIIVWPLAWLTALVVGASWRWLLAWAALSCLVIGAYFYGYVSPGNLGSPLENIKNTGHITEFLLLYFGGPLSALGLPKSAAAGIVAVVLFVTATYSLQLSAAGRYHAIIALVATGLFIAGTSVMTASGRVLLGTAAAQASRYATPVLLFWAVSLLLLMSVPVAHSLRTVPIRGLQVALPAFAVFCLMQAEPVGEWILQTAFQVRQTGVAVALGITDPPNEAFGGVTPERVAIYRPTLAAHHSSMFYDAEQLGLGHKLDDRYTMVPSQNCVGSNDAVTPVEAPRDGLRIHGWAWDVTRKRVPKYVLFADSSGTIVGWAETGGLRSDVTAIFPQMKHSRPEFGGYALLPQGSKVRSFVLNEAKGTVCPF